MASRAGQERWSRLFGSAVVRLGDSRLGRRFTVRLSLERPDLLLGALGYSLSMSAQFGNVDLPESLLGFEDVAPVVLSSNRANRGVSSMSLVEVAHLWRLAAGSPTNTLVEIGRERGGSTLVMAAAMPSDGTLFSYDPQSKHGVEGELFDRQLGDVLARYDLDARVRILDESSATATPPEGRYGLVLVDGDPSYGGTRSDYERFCLRLAPGGRALFHDAAGGGQRQRELAPLMDEIQESPTFARQPDVGTFADFMRTA